VDDTTYTVGALAKASGLTVRTLHHWDAMSAELQQYVGRATAARGS
jgi:DNA-binding transcriptional MerR regulator